MADQNDDIFEEAGDAEDETAAIIRRSLEESGWDDDEDDDAGLDQPPAEEIDTDTSVSVEEGARLASKAKLEGPKPKEPEAKDEGDDDTDKDDPAAETTDDKETPAKGEGDEGAAEPADLTASSVDDLLKGTPKAARAEITRRLSDAESALAPFQTPYMKQQMQAFGATPADAAKRLSDLASFAAEKPDEYIAWVAQEMASAPDKIGDVLQAAAARHGYKVVKDEGEEGDDLFDDPDLRAAKARIKELEAQVNGGGAQDFGPDAPARRAVMSAQDQLQAFQTERDETGAAKRPYFQHLQPQITAKAKAFVQANQRPVTVQDLDTFYNEAVSEMQALMGGGTNSAAQGDKPTAQQKQDAARVEKSKRASMTVDGAGQGAPRHSAQDADDLEGFIGAQVRQMLQG